MAGAAAVVAANPNAAQAYAVPDLPYPFEALEPVRCDDRIVTLFC